MQAFRRNLEHMLSRCQENGVPVILGTVPSNLVRPYLPKEAWQRYQVPWHRYEQGRWRDGMALGRQILRSTLGRHQASDAENDIIREVARQQGVSLADVEAAVIRQEPNGVPGETLFRDHCHLNETGNQLWRETYEALIRTALPAH
jgi:hypothetical protein